MLFGIESAGATNAHTGAMGVALAEVALEQRNKARIHVARHEQRISQLQQHIAEEPARINVSRAYGHSAAATLDLVIQDLSKFTGIPVEELKARYNKSRTIEFNKICNSWLAEGALLTDPRLNKEHEKLSWYVKGLDADRGF